MKMVSRDLWKLSLLIVFLTSFADSLWACPACGPVLEPTWSERLARSDVALLVQWVEGKPGKGPDAVGASTTFEIVQIARDTDNAYKKGQRLFLPKYISGKPGNLFFRWGVKKNGKVEWRSPVPISETAYHYITQAPSPEVPGSKRLRFFLKFFEYPDNLIANDAYIEFAKASYEDVKSTSDVMDRKKIRKWLTDPETPQSRIGLYGLMLGMCGTKEDIPFLENRITQFKEEFRLGVDGVIAGYLMLVGEKGMDLIDRTKFLDTKAPQSETYSALLAIRIIWTYGNGKISKDRLRKSMRLLIDRPELAELAIPDLARWRDWTVQDRLMKLYGQKDYDTRSVKTAIIKYLIASTQDLPKDKTAKLPPHVVKGRQMIETIKQKDPKTYRIATRTFF
ncbi:MAG: hypothetical protein Tsb009_03700 [Planctomycetaceae bacterium]